MEIGDVAYITRNNRLFKLQVVEELPLENEYRFHNTNVLPEAVRLFIEDFQAGETKFNIHNDMLTLGTILLESARDIIISHYRELGGQGTPSSVVINAELKDQGFTIQHLVEKSKLFKQIAPWVVGKASARVLSRL